MCGAKEILHTFFTQLVVHVCAKFDSTAFIILHNINGKMIFGKICL